MTSIQQMTPIPNNSIPVMGSVPVVYQQPMAGQLLQYQKKPYVPRERNPNEEQCKIFVGAVGRNTSEASLREYFGKFGEIADSVIMCDKCTGEPRGFAFVTFKTPEAVQAVIDQNNKGGHTLDGKTIDPKPAVPQGPGQQNQLTPLSSADNTNLASLPQEARYDAEKAATGKIVSNSNPSYKGPMKVVPELKIFVGGIGIGTTDVDVQKYFSTFGKVLQVDMPYHHIYKCPKGFAFVGFESADSVAAVTKDRYHQINGKTVEVKGADEQAQHFSKRREDHQFSAMASGRGRGIPQTQAISTVGLGAYGMQQQQFLIPQNIGGVTQYTPVQIPQTQAGGYVYDPATNTYYQLPATPVIAPSAGAAVVAGQQFAAQPGVTYLTAGAAGAATAQRTAAIGGMYSSETSQFGPARSHILSGGAQQPMAGNTVDPHVVYSTSTSISAGDVAAVNTQRGYHPYGR